MVTDARGLPIDEHGPRDRRASQPARPAAVQGPERQRRPVRRFVPARSAACGRCRTPGATQAIDRYAVEIPEGTAGPIAVSAAVYYQSVEAIVAEKFLGNMVDHNGNFVLEPCVLGGLCDGRVPHTEPAVVEGAPPVPMIVRNWVIADRRRRRRPRRRRAWPPTRRRAPRDVYPDVVVKVVVLRAGHAASTRARFTLTDAAGAPVPAAVDQIGPGTLRPVPPPRAAAAGRDLHGAPRRPGVCDAAGNRTARGSYAGRSRSPPDRGARDRQHRRPRQLRHPLATGRADSNHEARSPPICERKAPWPPLNRCRLTSASSLLATAAVVAVDRPSRPRARPGRRRHGAPRRSSRPRRRHRRRPAPRMVGGHVGAAVPVVSFHSVGKTTQTPSDQLTIAVPIGVSVHLAPAWVVDFEIVVASDVKPWGGTGLTIDPGVIYVGAPVALGLRAKFDVVGGRQLRPHPARPQGHRRRRLRQLVRRGGVPDHRDARRRLHARRRRPHRLRLLEDALSPALSRFAGEGDLQRKEIRDANAERNEDAREPEGRVRRRIAGQPPLPVLRQGRRRRGLPEVAGNFRDTAEGETGHAHGHLDYLKQVGDPATDLPIGDTVANLKAAVAGETHEYTDMYPGMAKTARDEGFAEIADWFETLAKAEKAHAGRFQALLGQARLTARAARPDRRRRDLSSRRVLRTDRRPRLRPGETRATGTRPRCSGRRRACSRSAPAVACASSTATRSRSCSRSPTTSTTATSAR